ncbi:MAG: hypothetical protein BWK75_05660 [Candidatus Altiarchaeales archaeon A3]|nr:MAG: hypothetical protein BWK75_05660 [Candidatus Altiarchaeales archaeon A3]
MWLIHNTIKKFNLSIIEAIFFIDTNNYEYSIPVFVKEVAKKSKIHLKIHNIDINNFFAEHLQQIKGGNRPCQHTFIIQPLNSYTTVNTNAHNQSAIVWGGTLEQRWKRWPPTHWLSREKNHKFVHIIKPLFKLAFYERFAGLENMEKEWGMWEGYKRGINRTSCLKCPFCKTNYCKNC